MAPLSGNLTLAYLEVRQTTVSIHLLYLVSYSYLLVRMEEEYGTFFAMPMHELQTFIELDDEPFYACWERYKGLFYGVPHHVYDDFQKAYYFYEGLSRKSKYFVDVMCNGDFLDKTPAEALDYFAHLAKASLTGVYFYTVDNASERRIFIADSDLDSEKSFEFGGDVEPDVHCPPPVDPSLCDDLGEKFLIVEETNAEVDFLYALLNEQDGKNVNRPDSLSPSFEEIPSIEILNHPIVSALDDATPPIESPLSQEFLTVELIDFVGVDEFDLVYHPYIVDFVNSVKINLLWHAHLVKLKCLHRIRQLRYSKYLFLWYGLIQFWTKILQWRDVLMVIAFDGLINVRSPRVAEHSFFLSLSLSLFFFSFDGLV